MSGGRLKELQALIAFACYDSPSLFRRGASLSKAAIENVMSSIFCGDEKNGTDPDLITYVDQFMLGLNKFKGCVTVKNGGHCESKRITIQRWYVSIRNQLGGLHFVVFGSNGKGMYRRK